MGVKNWKLAGNNLESQIETVQRKFSLPRPIAVYFAARGKLRRARELNKMDAQDLN